MKRTAGREDNEREDGPEEEAKEQEDGEEEQEGKEKDAKRLRPTETWTGWRLRSKSAPTPFVKAPELLLDYRKEFGDYSYWCGSFEFMNEVDGGMPTDNQEREEEEEEQLSWSDELFVGWKGDEPETPNWKNRLFLFGSGDIGGGVVGFWLPTPAAGDINCA